MSEPADPVQNQLAKLKKKYAADLPQKVARVEEQVVAFLGADWSEEVCLPRTGRSTVSPGAQAPTGSGSWG